LLVILLPVLLVTIDNTILNFALPRIAVALNPSAAAQLWMIDAYSLVLAALLVTMGSSGDRFGHRRLLFIGCGGFAVVSLLLALSRQDWQLIGGRALLGVFGAMILPATLALIRSAFEDREERRVAVAAWATCLTLGSALGPLLGGVLLQYFDWPAVFLVALPFLLPVLLLAPSIRDTEHQPGTTVDAPSILLSLAAMTCVMLACKQAATRGIDAQSVLCLLAGLAWGLSFVRRQLQLEQPLLDLRLFRHRAFSVSILVNLVSLGLLIGFIFFATQLLQLVFGLSPLTACLILVPGQVLALVAGMAIIHLARRVAPNRLIAACLLLAAAAFALMALVEASVLSLGIAFLLLNVSVAAITSVSNDLVLCSVPVARAGSASSVSETAYEVGVVLGTTLIGGAVAAWYRLSLVLPEGLSAEALRSAQTLGGAHALEGGEGLLLAVNTAFREGVSVTSAGVALLVLVFALLTWRGLRGTRV